MKEPKEPEEGLNQSTETPQPQDLEWTCDLAWIVKPTPLGDRLTAELVASIREHQEEEEQRHRSYDRPLVGPQLDVPRLYD
jgi:hypothetical protein